MPFEWTPDYWQEWREASNPYRRFKSERDRSLTLQALRPSEGERILEVGCGYGWITEALLAGARIRWVGLDRSESMVRRLRTSLGQHVPGVLVGDACHLPFPSNSFDKVICTGVLMHLADEFAALKEMARVLRCGGLLVCSMNNSLSLFSLLMRVHNASKQGFIQNYRSVRTYRKYLRRLGFQIQGIRGDGLVTPVSFRMGRFSFPPRWAFSTLRAADHWMVDRIPWLAYEVWFAAVKVGKL